MSFMCYCIDQYARTGGGGGRGGGRGMARSKLRWECSAQGQNIDPNRFKAHPKMGSKRFNQLEKVGTKDLICLKKGGPRD